MSDHVFYSRPNRGNQRKVTLGPPQMLISKPPTKSKRIKLKLTMGLSTQKHTGAPEWITNAFEFVSKNHDPVAPEVDFKGFDINFATENLFQQDGITAVKSQLRSFRIEEQGDSENPDVVMVFYVYAAFSTALWEWLGQMAGDEVWAKFVQIEQPAEEEDDNQLELNSEDEETEETEEEDEDEEAEE